MNRKLFLQQAAVAWGIIAAAPYLAFAQTASTQQQPGDDPLAPEKVKEFVIAGHSDLAKTKSLLVETPSLLYATWDWGDGDFETALEGAGHVGNKDIANFLIDAGARTN